MTYPLKTITIDIPNCPADATGAMFTDGNIALIAFLVAAVVVAAIITVGIVLYRKFEGAECE